MIRPLTFVRYPNYEHSDTSGVEPFETVLRGHETQTFAYGDRFVHLKNTRDNERAKSNFTSHFIA